MSKHTPGPWVIDWNVSRLDVFSGDAATLIASIRRSALSAGIDETARANARLIAAAPELLVALQAEHEWRERDEAGAIDPEWDYETMVGSKRRAAIAKATGDA